MSPNLNFTSPKRIAEEAKKIYEAQYRADLEKTHMGDFVAINVLDGSATVASSMMETLEQAKKKNPNGIFHLIRIGYAGAFEVGLAYRNVDTDRLPGR